MKLSGCLVQCRQMQLLIGRIGNLCSQPFNGVSRMHLNAECLGLFFTESPLGQWWQ